MEQNTFSITARDANSQALGVAVATKLPCVGATCPWVRAGVGAIATQSFVNPYLGIDGLRLLAEGLGAQEALDRLLVDDAYKALRQIAIVDRIGGAAAFSGDNCTKAFGHIVGNGFVVAGNMLVGERVLSDMHRAYSESRAGTPFPERLLEALEAGQAAGGDRRGKQSAALYVATTEEYGYVDIRVDDHQEPVNEMRRLYEVVKEELLPIIDQLPTRANPLGTRTPEDVAAARAAIEAIPVDSDSR